jgi:DNA-binding HxlR family transcriptional regulator
VTGNPRVTYDRAVAERAEPSALDEALRRVGDRWSLLLVQALLGGPHRFNDLLEGVPGISSNVLADRLRRLEGGGVVSATAYSERPRRYSYELTASGRDLAGALRLLADWGAGGAGEGEAPRHRTCGTPMEARWFCPTCSVPVDDGGDELEIV